MSLAAPALVTTTADALPTVPPNSYHLTGNGITVAYYPDGFGPPQADGRVHMIYQDANGTLAFMDSDVRVLNNTDLGEVASVTIRPTVDTGRTTFSLLIPAVALSTPASVAAISTVGITTVHRSGVLALGRSQRDTYVITTLAGEAAFVELPDGEQSPALSLPAVAVPNIFGDQRQEAAAAVEQAGLKLRLAGRGDLVIRQSPAAGRLVPRGAYVVAVLGTEA